MINESQNNKKPEQARPSVAPSKKPTEDILVKPVRDISKKDKDDKSLEVLAGKDGEIKPDPRKDKMPKHKKRDHDDSEEDSAAAAAPKEPEFMEKVIAINRITKVTKGGKKLSFSALVVVGDAKGKVGYSLSKAAEVSIAIRKAIIIAKKNMKQITLKGSTIPHEIIGQCGGARVLLKPASDGTGVIAAGPVRAVCDGAGIRNILTKCHRSNNPINVIKATMDGLERLKSQPNKDKVIANADQ
jgi:small subunit ribosomal protein S5